jgi:hypothetical protein
MAPFQRSKIIGRVRSLLTKILESDTVGPPKPQDLCSASLDSPPPYSPYPELSPPPIHCPGKISEEPGSDIRSTGNVLLHLQRFKSQAARVKHQLIRGTAPALHYLLVQRFLRYCLTVENDASPPPTLTQEDEEYFAHLGMLAHCVHYHVKQYGWTSLPDSLYEEIFEHLDVHFNGPVRTLKIDDDLALKMLFSFQDRWNRLNRGEYPAEPIYHTNEWYLGRCDLKGLESKLEGETEMARVLFTNGTPERLALLAEIG